MPWCWPAGEDTGLCYRMQPEHYGILLTHYYRSVRSHLLERAMRESLGLDSEIVDISNNF